MGGYDNTLGMYPGQTRTGFNNIISFNQSRQYNGGGMPGTRLLYFETAEILRYCATAI